MQSQLFSGRPVSRLVCAAIAGLSVCAAADIVRADDDHDHDRGHRRTEIHVAIPGIVQVDVGHGPPPVATGFVVETRGPVHEAFAEPVLFDPTAGLVVPHSPPAPIDEVPPDVAPVGGDVAWVPGYWGWDDDRATYIWVSGIWRNMPPGQQFVPGYWRQVGGGFQWVSGFWQAESVQEVQYLPPPPESLETEPAAIPPAPNYVWVPGVWVWSDVGYLWRPGYWVPAQRSWVWVPDHYVWAPAGYVFVRGYWDYSVPRRGVLFAPVYMPQVVAQPALVVARPIVYTPTVVVNASILVGNMFARPNYCHYYFGDYYDRHYFQAGIYPAFSFHESRYGYSPMFAHYIAFQHGSRSEIVDRLRQDYRYRRDHVDARPPRTYDDMRRLEGRRDVNPRLASFVNLAQPLNRVVQTQNQSKNPPLRYQTVQRDRLGTYRQAISQTRQFQTERKRLETERTPAATAGPSITRSPESPRAVTPAAPTTPPSAATPAKTPTATPPRSVAPTPARPVTPTPAQPASPTPPKPVVPPPSAAPAKPATPSTATPPKPVTPAPSATPAKPATPGVSPATPAQPTRPGASITRPADQARGREAGKGADNAVRGQGQPMQLRLQRSPLAGRPMTKIEKNSAPPAPPPPGKTAAPQLKGKSAAPAAKRAEPKD
jgi:hypothetical protein